MTHTPSQSLLTKITSLANTIVGLVSTHENKTSSTTVKGHANAGGTPQAIGDSLLAGTDNGYYARADHVHTVDYSKIQNKPTTFTPSSHTHTNLKQTQVLSDTPNLDTITTDGFYAIPSTVVQNITNGKPTQAGIKAARLEVKKYVNGNVNVYIQTYYETSPLKIFYRISDSNLNWDEWIQLDTSNNETYNLIPNSQEFLNCFFTSTTDADTITNETYKNFTVRRLNSSELSSGYKRIYWKLPKVGTFKQGDIYTFSFWAKGTGGILCYSTGASDYMATRAISWDKNAYSTPSVNYGDGGVNFVLTNEWYRYFVTWRLNPSANDTALGKRKDMILQVNYGNDAYICGPMLEKGTTIHDWSPHMLDDVYDMIGSAITYINQ